jgi:predicted RNA-binding protein
VNYPLVNSNRIWLCVINEQSFKIIKENHVYAIPDNPRALRMFRCVEKGDILLFYLRSPVMKIMGMSHIVSEPFEEKIKNTPFPLFGKSYPYRVRISDVTPFIVLRSDFVGKIRSVPRISMGISIIDIDEKDFEKLKQMAKV